MSPRTHNGELCRSRGLARREDSWHPSHLLLVDDGIVSHLGYLTHQLGRGALCQEAEPAAALPE